MKIKKVFLILILFLTNIFANPYAQGEMWIRVTDSDGLLETTITVYDSKGYFVDSAISASYTVEQDGNAFMYMTGEPISNPNASYVIGPLNYSRTYYFVIGSKYAKVGISSHDDTPDEHLYYNNGVFSLESEHDIYTLVSQGNWLQQNLIFQNSFGSGTLKIDYNDYAHNTQLAFGTPTFPHRLEANDEQNNSCGVTQLFNKWSGPNGFDESTIIVNIPVSSGTYTANFKSEFDVSFVNSHPCSESGGPIKYNSTQFSSPAYTTVISPSSITAEAINHSINHIWYTFTSWNEGGGTTNPKTFTPDDNTNYIASFEGTPTNGYRNQRFNTKVVGQAIKVYWDQHPNTCVTKYKVYRKPKYGSESCVATVSRTGDATYTYTFTDPDMVHTNSSSSYDLYYYDVRAYYSPSDNYSDYDFKAVYAEMGGPIADDNPNEERMQIAEKIYEYGISNYPNPYNPTTTINYQIKEMGNVNITVFDALGRTVKVLVNDVKEPGDYNILFDGTNLSNGVYYYRMHSGNFVETKKMIMMK